MKIEFFNCPQPEKMQLDKLAEVPEFIHYQPDFHMLKNFERAYEKYPNLLIIGQGGSINNFYGIYSALLETSTKAVYFLNTVDPDYIFELRKKLNSKNTLVIAISKSGETTTVLEAYMPFVEFPTIFLVGKNTPMREMAERLKVKVVYHPPIGGRYTALTEVGLLPAAICGMDIAGLFNGAHKIYQYYKSDNLAWKAASVVWQLEEKGIVDVFMPFYSHNLFGLSNFVVQLCHESFGKGGKGQTYFAHEAPESQHHTNQRFFGGRKNICGFFVSSDSFLHPHVNVIPTMLHSVQLKKHALFDLNKIPLEKSIEFELIGTLDDARIQGIPTLHLSIASFSSQEIGSFIAFWQLYAVYSSILRNVDPFDQPQVENSKNISFNKRLSYKGLL